MKSAWNVHISHQKQMQSCPGRIPRQESFAELLAAAKESWPTVQAQAKAEARSKASRQKDAADYNKVQKLDQVASDSTYLPSIWDISRGGEHPLHRDDIAKMLDTKFGFRDAARELTENCEPCGRHPLFPSSVPYRQPIPEIIAGLDTITTALAADITASLRVLLAPHGIKVDVHKPLLITSACGHKCIMQCLWVLKSPVFVGQFMFYRLHGDDGDIWSTAPIAMPNRLRIFAEGADSVVSLSDWAAHFAMVATPPLKYQRIEVDWQLSEASHTIYCKGLGEPIDIDAMKEGNCSKAAAMTALRLLNKALLPWQLQPKRRKAVLKRGGALPKCRDHGDFIEEAEVEPLEVPDDIDAMAWENASDASGAETDHALDEEFNCPLDQKKMDRLIEKASMIMATETMKKVTKKALAAKKTAPHKHGDKRPCFPIQHWGYIFIDKKYRRFEAQCGCRGASSEYIIHAPECKVQDHRIVSGPCTMQRVGKYLPLGFLIAWLRDGVLWDAHESHLEGRLIITAEECKDAREWAHGQPHLAALLEQEKAWADKSAGFDAAGNIEEPLSTARLMHY